VERTDIGFRIGSSPDEVVIGRRLFAIQLIVCAAPAYLDRHGVPTTLDDLARHRCSVFRHPATGKVSPWYLTVDGEVEQRHLPPALSTNDTELEIQAVLAGQVIGQIANFSAAPHIRAGRLVPVLLPHISDHMGLHIYYGSRASQPKRVRAFLDMAVARLLECPDYVLSDRELLAASRAWKRTRGRK